MTIYSELSNEYQRRYAEYSKVEMRDLVNKAYAKIMRGVEIKWKDIQSISQRYSLRTPLQNLLIELPQIKEVINQVEHNLAKIENSHEMQVQVVYGEYGQGKSQIANILLELFSDTTRFPNCIYFYHSVTTINSFIEAFISHLSNILTGKPFYSKIEPFLDQLRYAVDSRILITQIIETFSKIIKELSKRGYTTVLIFDEVDKALNSPDDFKPWGDLFVTLNDESDLKLLLVLLLPQSTAQQMLLIEPRLERWTTALHINAVYLTGKYLDFVPHAIGNILAMKAITERISFNTMYLEFAAHAISFQEKRLKSLSIRAVNQWAVQLAEMLIRLMNWNWDSLLTQFQHLDRTKKGQVIEKKLRTFLTNTQIPNFTLKNPDTNEFERYHITYSNDNLTTENKVSDGHFQIKKFVENAVVEETLVASEIKYTDTGSHDSEQINKVKILSTGFPTIFFSLGSNTETANLIRERINLWHKQHSALYPVLLIHIPKPLITPLLILHEDSTTVNPAKIAILTFWAKSLCDFMQPLENFFKNLPDKLLERAIAIRLEKLKQITQLGSIQAKQDQSPSISTTQPSLTTSTNNKTQLTIQSGASSPQPNLMVEAITLFCSYIDAAIKSWKTIQVLQRDVLKKVKKQYPLVADSFEQIFPQILQVLQNNNFILITTRGDKEIIKKTSSWNISHAAQLLIQQFS